MTENGQTQGTTPGPDAELEARLARALAEREEAVEAAIRGDDANDLDATFVDRLRAEWVGEAPVPTAVESSSIEAMHRAVRPGPRATRVRRWAPLAAAAAVALGVWVSDAIPGHEGGQDADSTTDGPSGLYLGGDAQGEGAQPFEGTVDWSSEAGDGAYFEVVIRDVNAPAGAPDEVDRVDAHPGTTWTCPDALLDSLPAVFRVEVRDIMGVAGADPLFEQLYRRR